MMGLRRLRALNTVQFQTPCCLHVDDRSFGSVLFPFEPGGELGEIEDFCLWEGWGKNRRDENREYKEENVEVVRKYLGVTAKKNWVHVI